MSKSKQQPAITGGPSPALAKSKRGGEQKPVEQAAFQPNAAGIDIGAREIYVAVPADRTIPSAMWDLYRGSQRDGRVAGELWRYHGRDGIHRGVLDSYLRRGGAARNAAVFGESP